MSLIRRFLIWNRLISSEPTRVRIPCSMHQTLSSRASIAGIVSLSRRSAELGRPHPWKGMDQRLDPPLWLIPSLVVKRPRGRAPSSLSDGRGKVSIAPGAPHRSDHQMNWYLPFTTTHKLSRTSQGRSHEKTERRPRGRWLASLPLGAFSNLTNIIIITIITPI